MNDLLTRTCTGAGFTGVILASLLLPPWVYALVFSMFLIFSLYEYYRLVLPRVSVVGIVAGVGMFLLIFCKLWLALPYNLWVLTVPLLLGIFIGELYANHFRPAVSVALILSGLLYVALPFTLLNYLRFPFGGYAAGLLPGFFGLLWMSDTAAYLCGTAFGKHRLFERVSPQKSWEGLAGAALITVLAAWPLSRWVPDFSLSQWGVMAVLIVIFGVFGDLFESLLKRVAGVKDSGRWLPGHGGFLDRFDSVLFAAPAVYVYLYFFVF